jgi:hypothetical protein
LVSVIDTGSIPCEAVKEILCITCWNVGLEMVKLYRSTVKMEIAILHACAVCHTRSLFPLQLPYNINYIPTPKHSCIFCNVFFWDDRDILLTRIQKKPRNALENQLHPAVLRCQTFSYTLRSSQRACVTLFKRIQETLRLLCSGRGPANCYGTSEDFIYLPDGTVGRVNLNLSGSRRRT